jgi:Ca2+-transporting ATPase
MAFTILSVDSLLYVFSSRSLHQPIWRNVPWKNPWLLGAVGIGFGIQLLAIYLPWLQGLLKTVPLGLDDWMVVMVVSLTVIGVIEVAKAVFAHHRIIGEGKIRVE